MLETLVNNLRKNDDPERFYNLAETGISLHPKSTKSLLPEKIENYLFLVLFCHHMSSTNEKLPTCSTHGWKVAQIVQPTT